jgi:hypothetical protein
LALASRLLMHAAVRLLGPQQAAWARAMRAELPSAGSEREALAFAWGCFCAALGHALVAARAGFAQVQNAGVLSCSAAVLLGCVFMHSAGAPGHYVPMNLLSLAFAVATFRLLPRWRLQADELLRARLSFAMGALLLIAGLGQAFADASAWLRLGPVPVNLAWLLLPALLVAADVRSQSSARLWAMGGVLMACGALALLGDAMLMGLAAAVLGVRAWHCRSGALALLALATSAIAVPLGQAWQAPEALAFVDKVLQSGLEQSLVLGLALGLLQVLPLWPALCDRQARLHGLVWGLLVTLSLPGWLPSPLVGFGGSCIAAYLLSLALIAGDPAARPIANPLPSSDRRRRDPPTWPRSGLT